MSRLRAGRWTSATPLTEPLSITATRDGARHHLLVQAFAQVTLIADLDQPDASGAPTIATQPAGRDYLLTAGGPTVRASALTQRWVTANGALRTAAGASAVVVGLNANSAVTLSGAAQWVAGDLWYAVSWRTPSRNGQAWVDASALTDTTPSAIPVNGFDALSPDLAKYLAGRGRNTGVVAYDVTRGVMYTYNSDGLFIMASSAKVPLLISYLEYIESQGRGPNSYEVVGDDGDDRAVGQQRRAGDLRYAGLRRRAASAYAALGHHRLQVEPRRLGLGANGRQAIWRGCCRCSRRGRSSTPRTARWRST